MTTYVNANGHAVLTPDSKRDLEAWVTDHGIEIHGCWSAAVEGQEAVFVCYAKDELGKFYQDTNGDVARITPRVPLLRPMPDALITVNGIPTSDIPVEQSENIR